MISVNGEYRIAVGYKRLLQLMIEKNMSNAELMQKSNISDKMEEE